MGLARVQLHGVQLDRPDLAHASHSLAITARSLSGDLLMHFAINAYWDALDFELPALPAEARDAGATWRRVIDSSQPAPDDLMPPAAGPVVHGPTHRVASRSVVVLFAQIGPAAGGRA
jgi:glycogen operon protein